MVDQNPRDPWRIVWHIATSNSLLALLLLGAAIGLLTIAWLPQTPAADPAAYARWLSEAQSRFGKAVPVMQAIGLFTVANSFGFRTLLALIAGTLLLRLVERGGKVLSGAAHRTGPGLFSLLAHGGGLLLLAGLLVTQLWGWRVDGLIVQSGEQMPIPGSKSWVALDEDTLSVKHSPGVIALVEEQGPGVRVSAVDGEGNPLAIQQIPETSPTTELALALTKDRYFTVPDAQLVTLLTLQADHPTGAHDPIHAQVYRSPLGQPEADVIIEKDREIKIGDVTMNFVSAPYARVIAIFNPGQWPSSMGVALILVGLGGNVIHSVRRLGKHENKQTGEED